MGNYDDFIDRLVNTRIALLVRFSKFKIYLVSIIKQLAIFLSQKRSEI